MSTTHCPYCALQCAMHLEPAPDGTLAARPAPFPTNRGGLCRKGWTAPELLTHPDRLTTPLIRRHGRLEPATWDQALDTAAHHLNHLRQTHGPHANAVFGSGSLTNEKAYLLGKFARLALGTSQIDYNGRFCMSSAAAATNHAFGLDRGLPFPLTDIATAQAVLLAGANPAETMPPMMGHLAAPTLIVIDPRRSATAQQALDHGGLHLAPRPGTDLPLALGLLHAARTAGHLDHTYIDQRTTGFQTTWAQAAAHWPERTEELTGVPAHHIRAAADLLGHAARNRSAYVLTGRGSEQHATGTATAGAWIDLALALGLPGRTGSGYGCITGQGNGQGGREHGQKADQLPGYRHINDPDARTRIAHLWNTTPESLPGPGRSATELLAALGTPDGPRSLLVMGSNPAVSAPDTTRIKQRLAALDHLIVCDFVLSETAQQAHVVLPTAQWAEEEGTMTNLEGRLLRRTRAQHPPPGVRTDLQILSELAPRLGADPHQFPHDADTVLAELAHASAGGRADYSGIDPHHLAAGHAQYWPAPATAGPDTDPVPSTPRLFLDTFAHPDGRARFSTPTHHGPAETTDTHYPLWATTGRLLGHYQSGAQTRRITELATTDPEATVQIHPDTATHHGLTHGDHAQVTSRRGTMTARVHTTPTARHDTVFVPFHYANDQAANTLTQHALDPTSRMPEFKVSAVRITPAPDPATEGRP
ncbi:molybdopterin oxidoreductase family protein [Nocardiopsis salina]|uniref:molybdopterin oxidoreductase family protein n=1 Tax=Nocardiopsis salina TaxID=245836 RepID=UPI000345DB67|nr:molybdopterin oxidoreductase family protein [Nocardiopsis salina]